jgi:hypothetical protein
MRRHVGPWEGDTLIGARHRHAILGLVERKMGYAALGKIDRKNSELRELRPHHAAELLAPCVVGCIADPGSPASLSRISPTRQIQLRLLKNL